jgi:hypothetical protein
VAFPEIRKPESRRVKSSKRPDAQRESRRVVAMGDRRAQSVWSRDQVISAANVMATQVEVLEQESNLDHWLTRDPAGWVEPSEVPTSPYQQYCVLAAIRGSQLTDARRALLLFNAAVERAGGVVGSGCEG